MTVQASPQGETDAEREERLTQAWVDHLAALPADTPCGWLEAAYDAAEQSPERGEAHVAYQRIVDGLAEVATGAQCDASKEAA